MPVIPASIELMGVVGTQLGQLTDYLTKDVALIRDQFSRSTRFSEADDLCQNPTFMRYYQLWLTVLLSSHRLPLMPDVRGLQSEGDQFKCWFSSGVKTTIRFGEYTTEFGRYYRVVLGLVGIPVTRMPAISIPMMTQFSQKLDEAIAVLASTKASIERLDQPAVSIESLLKQTPVRVDILFMILMGFSFESINLLCRMIADYLPEDLEMVSAEGNRVDVGQMLAHPSSDRARTMMKLKVYYELVLSKDMPIIAEITQSKTVQFIWEKIQNPQFWKAVVDQLQSVIQSQIVSRETVYGFYQHHVTQVLGE